MKIHLKILSPTGRHLASEYPKTQAEHRQLLSIYRKLGLQVQTEYYDDDSNPEISYRLVG